MMMAVSSNVNIQMTNARARTVTTLATAK